uniref:DBIRD complex subunit ZNF326-like n=1 Tax=Myxine glutinosa TaxID=7769 RepID=UPI00358FA83B
MASKEQEDSEVGDSSDATSSLSTQAMSTPKADGDPSTENLDISTSSQDKDSGSPPKKVASQSSSQSKSGQKNNSSGQSGEDSNVRKRKNSHPDSRGSSRHSSGFKGNQGNAGSASNKHGFRRQRGDFPGNFGQQDLGPGFEPHGRSGRYPRPLMGPNEGRFKKPPPWSMGRSGFPGPFDIEPPPPHFRAQGGHPWGPESGPWWWGLGMKGRQEPPMKRKKIGQVGRRKKAARNEHGDMKRRINLKNGFGYKYTCTICRFNTFVEDEMQHHVESVDHNKVLKAVVDLFPHEKALAPFLHDVVMHKMGNVTKRRQVWEELNGIPFAPNDPFAGIELPDCMTRMLVVKCNACRVFLPSSMLEVEVHLKDHGHEELHEVFWDNASRYVENVAQFMITNMRYKCLYEKFKNGEDPWAEMDDVEEAEEAKTRGIGKDGADHGEESFQEEMCGVVDADCSTGDRQRTAKSAVESGMKNEEEDEDDEEEEEEDEGREEYDEGEEYSCEQYEGKEEDEGDDGIGNEDAFASGTGEIEKECGE